MLSLFFKAYENSKKTEAYTVEEFKSEISAEEPEKEEYVYITDTGEKYHEKGCRYLYSSCVEISFEKAQSRGYSPCSVCSP